MKSFHIIVSVLVALVVVFSSLFISINQSNSPVEAATSWTQSPVSIGNEKYIIDSYVIKDGATYKMWYTHLKMDLSLDGLYNQLKTLNLDNLLNALQSRDWVNFIKGFADLNIPALWGILDGIYTEIGYATSVDGKNWTVVKSDALTGSGTDFWTSVGFPNVIKIDDTHYQMWYTRLDSTLTQVKLQNIFTDMGSPTPAVRKVAIGDLLNSTGTVIGYATSSDGVIWTEQKPTAFAGTGGAYNLLNSVGAPSVILEGATYKMWYTRLKTDFTSTDLDNLLTKVNLGSLGAVDFIDIIDGTSLVIGYATSLDGINWNPVNNEVLSGGAALWQSVADPCVVKSGSTYYMWHTGIVSNLTDVTGWRSVFNGLISANIPSLWNSMKTKGFSDFITDLVSINIAGLKTALTDNYGIIRLATSADGITWLASSIDMDRTTGVNQWGGVGAPSVVKSTFQTEIWFSQGIPALTWQNIVDRIQGVDSGLGYAKVSTLILGGGGGGAPSPITGIGKVCYPLTPLGYTTVNITLTSEDEMCTIFIPKATLTQTKDYEELKCISCSLMLTPPTPPAGKIVMVAYNIAPNGALFEPSVTVSIKYAPESIPVGVKESSLKLAYFDSTTGIWNNLNNVVVDTDKHLISGKTNHFTPFGILSDKGTEPAPPTPPPPITPPTLKPAIYITSALTVSPTVVKPGEMVTIDVTVTNTGEQAGTYTVKLIINNVITKTQDVTLKAGESKSISFAISENVAGTYHVGIDRLAGSFVVQEATAPPSTITPVPIPPALKPTNWGLIAAGIILGVVLIVLAGWLIITRSEKG